VRRESLLWFHEIIQSGDQRRTPKSHRGYNKRPRLPFLGFGNFPSQGRVKKDESGGSLNRNLDIPEDWRQTALEE